jgi:fucose 4-O-acetylase-like acetyltransferase
MNFAKQNMRNERIDLLRSIGLLMIIFAHSEPPAGLFQLRNFDVPLMVLVSGLSFAISYRNEKFPQYIWKRIKRLVLPVWLFLGVYFCFIHLTGKPSPPPSAKVMASSFALLSGIGYVWVIRVFLLVAAIAPFAYRFNARTPSNSRYFSTLLVVYLIFELLVHFENAVSKSAALQIIDMTAFCAIPYGTIFCIGLRLGRMTNKEIAMLCAAASITFLVFGLYLYKQTGALVPTQNFKYPPTAYYLSYAMAVSCALWLASDGMCKSLRALRLFGFFEFMSRNSIWIYLWHIPLLAVVDTTYAAKFAIVLFGATGIMYAQSTVVLRILLPRIGSAAMSNQLRSLLLG